MKEDYLAEARAKFRQLADEATDDEVRDLSSAVHMGLQVVSMIDSLSVAKDRMNMDGFPSGEYEPMAVNQVTHTPTGKHYQINVREVDDEEVADFTKAVEKASSLDKGITRH